ncbi:hypothetical protein SAMN05428982_1921 [Pseudoxanthomonas sp. CF385]|uniref:hypothetical protein n=1 Tax=Pseudoxanthomonas sp. CF385 TaxID=1881042 RepID=UPI000881E681|nr:hypothetical protein [Pseudoxanthomonas sp. CF385]SDQ63927.1 hypothetical protein SAMN05428982_1921 [Pseudoxanthomonas sp. CF385]
MTNTLDAADLDTAFHALARIGRRRGRLDPTIGTLDRALVDSLTGLQELRAHLDRETVAAGLASPYIARHLQPTSSTRLAAAQAQQEQRVHELAAQVERERRSAVNGRRGWADRETSAP